MTRGILIVAEKSAGGFLYVGTTGHREVVINHPDIDPDKDGNGHIIFTPDQARSLAYLLLGKADEAEKEVPR